MDVGRCKIGREYITTDNGREHENVEKQQHHHATKTERVLGGLILELPVHLIYDILSRLTTKTIISCRCVCKKFLEILRDPYFAELHHSKAPNIDYSFIIQDRSTASNFLLVHMFDLEKPSSPTSWNSDHHDCDSRPCQTLIMPSSISQFGHVRVTLVGSRNGLLCLHYQTQVHSVYYVCNPVLGEFMVLPQHGRRTIHLSAFGFCPRTKQYKVIRFNLLSFDYVATPFCEIHTLGTKFWRTIGNAPFPRTQGSFDSCLNGNLHWITKSCSVSDMICSFNLETERFRYIPPPTHFNQDIVNKMASINVGALGGLLCVCFVLEDAQFEVWVMKDYGVESSWTKEFIIDIKFYCGLQPRCLHYPIMFLNNGDLLLNCDVNSIVSYSPRKRTFRDLISLSLKVRLLDVIAHVSSFISLKYIAGVENVEVVQRKQLRSFWSEEGLQLIC